MTEKKKPKPTRAGPHAKAAPKAEYRKVAAGKGGPKAKHVKVGTSTKGAHQPKYHKPQTY